MSKQNIDFLKYAKPFTIMSIVLTLVSWLLIFTVGLNFGIDFAGGTEALIALPKEAKIQEEGLRNTAESVGLLQADVVRYQFSDGNQKGFFIRSRNQEGVLFAQADALKNALSTAAASRLIKWTDDQKFTASASISQDLVDALAGVKSKKNDHFDAILEIANELKGSVNLAWQEDQKSFTINANGKAAVEAKFAAKAIKSWDTNDENRERIRVQWITPIEDAVFEQALTQVKLNGVIFSKENELRNPTYVLSSDESSRLKNAVIEALKLSQEPESVYQNVKILRFEKVGATAGEQLRNQGALSVIYALFFILIYVALRFEPRYSPGAILALVHDVSLILGMFVLTGREFNLPIIAALLAIIGYSLNDTIVIYDRIRENLGKKLAMGLPELINHSVNETLSRTLLTSGTTLIAVLAIYLFGGGIVANFAFALLVGIVVGTYSSIYVASMIVIETDEYLKKKEALALEVEKVLKA